jgi:hypothetical protein
MISEEFNENTHNGVKYYEYDGIYFYRKKGIVDDDEEFMKLMKEYARAINNRPIYVYRAWTTGQIMCDFSIRSDCRLQKTIGHMKIMYRESDIDFADETVRSFIEQCWQEKVNYNVVRFIPGIFDNLDTDCSLTLADFLRGYCYA